VPAEDATSTECDLFAPCAIGGILSSDTIPGLRCSIVAGAANNQLLEEADADRLRAAGILYAPDFVINGGGIIRGVGAERLGWTDAQIDARVDAIGETLEGIYRDSERLDISTAAAAMRLAQEALTAEHPTQAGVA
jgi:leucine dehydrogenase